MIKELTVPINLKEENLDELISRIPYLCEDILSVSLNNDKIIMSFKPDADLDYFNKVFMELVKNVKNHRSIKQKILFSNDNSIAFQVENKSSDKMESNYFNEVDLTLLNIVDSYLVDFAKECEATVREYPTLMSYYNMEKNKYHKNFPQNIYSVFEIEHNYELIEAIRNEDNTNTQDELFRSSGYFLQPCICYHCYEELHNNTLESKVLTAKGKCFRHEVEWKKNKFRKNEFYMREIVCFGEKEYVLAVRDKLMKKIWDFFTEIKLAGKIITANDPFFFYDDMKKSTYQLMTDAKYELVASAPRGEEVSIASFNFCSDKLCENYNIRGLQGEYLFSGCTAFGLDRWINLIISTFGKDYNNWPELLRSKV
ncbi:aminoacyl--tRNA ligase-related protein [Bacillus cereus group sp. BfR-BA-01400]|uniref:aminoacyl--tRNA ligase-related protein n=1 Tax=Bacillus cereus group sp. BfR-BA-01400 TaxID=2920334 RepID=UPI001F5A749F